MSDHRIDPCVQDTDWGRMIWLIDGETGQNPGMSLARMEVDPGKTSEGHRHGNCNECLHLISGTISVYINDTQTHLQAGETVFIPANAVHYTQNLSETTAVMMISYSEEIRDYEAMSQS